MRLVHKLGLGAAAALLSFAAAPFALAGHTDNATLRAKAMDEWYNENYSAEGRDKAYKRGGPIRGAYRRFLIEAAARERARWAETLPADDGGAGVSSSLLDVSAALSATGTTWVNLGPTRADVIKNGSSSLAKIDSGRPRSIVVDPTNANVIYVAFAGGGVWKTTDGGASWAPKTETLGSLACGSLAIDPNNPSTLYLGLGDPFDGTGVGLVKTTDGGETWSAPVYLGSSTVTATVMVAPGNSSVVLAGTNQGLFRSTNGGTSWSPVALATGFTSTPTVWSLAWTGGSSFAMSLEATPELTTGTTNGQIWTSSNNGQSWTKATGVTVTGGVGRITVASAPSNRLVLYAMAAKPNNATATDLAEIFKSTNGGTSWTALGAAKKRYSNGTTESRNLNTLLNGQGWYNHMVAIHPTNPNTAYFGGALLLAKTTDGGVKFSQITNWLAQYGLPYVHADFHAASFDQAGAFYVGTDGGIFKSTDGGTTWSDALNQGLVTHLIYSVGSSTAAPDAVIGGFQDNGTRVRSGATSTFNQYIGGDGFGAHVHPTSGANMLGSLYYTRIYKSTNGGTTFTAACSGITECNTSNAPFITQIVPWAGSTTGNDVYTYVNAKVYKSTNYATSWTALGTSGLPTTSLFLRGFGIARTNASVMGVVANGGRVFLSINGGSTWTTPAALPNNGLSLSSIHFDSFDPNTVYVASVAPDAAATHLWKSTDFGASWTAIDGNGFPTGVPVNTIENDPNDSQVLYAGTHLGVYRSDHGGTTWARFGTGLPLVNVTDVYVSDDSSLVRAATFGRGFWELRP